MAVADKDILYRVAYDEAVRALVEQQAEIESFRTRAGLLFSSTAITTSFLGAQSFGLGDMSLASWMALIAFMGVAIASLAVLWPHSWEFSVNPRDALGPYLRGEEPVPVHRLHRELSLHMHSSYIENRAGIFQLAVLLQTASALLTLEVIFWIISIATAT
ncbi:MAG TPA: hypothetical protein VNC16_11555 [Solirubrobacterales bacterium]|jgi:hypothetical protein|nr:hypothetical protein [Solirubrobacterales bacterium]